MAVLGTVVGLASLSFGGSTAKKTQTPPINASSGDEEKFIQYVYIYLAELRALRRYDLMSKG